MFHLIDCEIFFISLFYFQLFFAYSSLNFIILKMKPNDLHNAINQCKNTFSSRCFFVDSKILIAGGCGFLCFPSVFGMFQCLVWKKMHIAAHKKLALVYGFFTVFVSSLVSHSVVEMVKLKQKQISLSYINEKDIVLCTFLSLTQFIIIAKSFRVVLPSNLLHPGAFAKKGIKLKKAEFFKPVTPNQRNKIQIIGYRYGCHTCGKKYLKFINSVKQLFVFSRVKVEYIADHQPPKAVCPENLKNDNLFLYPHCFSCSTLQAHQVRLAKKESVIIKNRIVTHILRLKLWKFFFPWTFFVNFNYIEETINNFLHYIF